MDKKVLILPIFLFLFLGISGLVKAVEMPQGYWTHIMNIGNDKYLVGFYPYSYGGALNNIYLTYNETSGLFKAYQYRPYANEVIQIVTDTVPETVTFDQARCYYYDSSGTDWVSFYCSFAYAGNVSYTTEVNISITSGILSSISHTSFSNSSNYEGVVYAINNRYDYPAQKLTGRYYGENKIHIFNSTSGYNLTLPTIFSQIYEALALEDPLTDRVFVFVVANHPNYPGKYYLYELQYELSTKNYLGLITLYTGSDLSYLGAYLDSGVLRLYAWDFDNNLWTLFKMGTIISSPAYGWYIPLETTDTLRISSTEKNAGYTYFWCGVGVTAGFCGTANVNWNITWSGGNFTTPTCTASCCAPTGSNCYDVTYIRVDTSDIPFGVDYNISVNEVTTSGAVFQTRYGQLKPIEKVVKDFPIILPSRQVFVDYLIAMYGPLEESRGYLTDSPISSVYFTQFDITPKTGNTTTVFTIKVGIEGGSTPYNLTIYQDSEIFYNILTSDHYKEITFTPGTVGTYSFYAKVVDSAGAVAESDTVQITVTTVGIKPFTLTIDPTFVNLTEADKQVMAYTSEIYGGTPPYTVKIRTVKFTIPILVECTEMAENTSCYGNFWASELSDLLDWYEYENGNYTIPLIAEAIDSTGGYITSTPVDLTIYRLKGPTLQVTIDLTPKTNLTTLTLTTVTANITGGIPPYTIRFWDQQPNMYFCEETVTTNPLPIKIYWYSGEHGIRANVWSSDGQEAYSNTIDFNVSIAYEDSTPINRQKNYVLKATPTYGCTGTWSNTTTDREDESYYGVKPTPTTVPYPDVMTPVINMTDFEKRGLGWVAPFFTPFFIVTIVILGVTTSIAKELGKFTGANVGLVFAIVLFIFVFILAITGFYPTWVAIIIEVGIAGIIALFLKRMFMGG